MGLSECLTLLLDCFSGRLCLSAHSITTSIYFRQRTRRVECIGRKEKLQNPEIYCRSITMQVIENLLVITLKKILVLQSYNSYVTLCKGNHEQYSSLPYPSYRWLMFAALFHLICYILFRLVKKQVARSVKKQTLYTRKTLTKSKPS